jgi:hypothetical protein
MAAAPPASRLDRYLAGLPDGLASYPQCQAKGSVFRNLFDAVDVDRSSLPEPLRRLLEDPPIASEWIAEAQVWALALAVADQRGMDRAALLDWTYRRRRQLFEGALYRYMMAEVPAAALVRTSALRWGAFHRGTLLEAGGMADDGARLSLAFPSGLFDSQVLEILTAVVRAALEASGARSAEVVVEESTATTARFRASWL